MELGKPLPIRFQHILPDGLDAVGGGAEGVGQQGLAGGAGVAVDSRLND